MSSLFKIGKYRISKDRIGRNLIDGDSFTGFGAVTSIKAVVFVKSRLVRG